VSAGLIMIAAAMGAPTALGGLQKGDQLTFVGTVAEQVARPGKEFRRHHDLELRVFVLDRTEKWADVAVLTRLKRTGDAVAKSAGTITSARPRSDAPPLIRLDLVRVHADGTAHLLVPTGPTPLRLNDQTPARALPLVPIDAFAASEFGVFPPRPPRDSAGEPWTVAAGPTRPSETWRVVEPKFFNAERCDCLVMNQQSADWVRSVGGTAWHRAEEVWVSSLDGTARKVHRVILQRDGRVESPPAAWVEVKYELKEQAKLTGRTFDRARRDVEAAYRALADAVLPLGPKSFETRLAKLEAYIQESDPTSAFGEALAAARRALEAARDGDVVQPSLMPMIGAAPAKALWPQPGQLAPDFRAGEFHLADHKGKPVILVFLRPNGETTPLALAVADALRKRYGPRVVVAPLIVFGEVAAATTTRDQLKLTVPLHNGAGAGMSYGVTTVPRFVLIDAAGKVRWTFEGIGAETGFLAREEVDRLAPPVSPNVPRGITLSPGPLGVPIVPPP
jgi:hypothetical protein